MNGVVKLILLSSYDVIICSSIVDATPNYFWSFGEWRRLAANKCHSEPKYTVAHIIGKVVPHAKVVVIIRDPIRRLGLLLDVFGDQLKLIRLEDYSNNRTVFVNNIFNFLRLGR